MNSTFTALHNDILLPERLNCPYFYQPHPVCIVVFEQIQKEILSMETWRDEIAKGKMFGLLVVKDENDNIGYVKAYSGQIGGRENWQGWAPAVFDYLEPDGYFKTHEAVISELNKEVSDMEHSARYVLDCSRLAKVKSEADKQIEDYRQLMSEQKRLRAERRLNGENPALLDKESQFQKAEMKRLKARLAKNIKVCEDVVGQHKQMLLYKKQQRKQLSDDLQHWLFTRFVVCNGKGEQKNLLDIFASTPQRVPPSGAGECCAPKLLQYAFSHKMKPIALAEFWWGASPVGEIRQHLSFYPACQGKCKPILDFMLQGVDVEPNLLETDCDIKHLDVVYIDSSFIVINKPAGLLAVPGKVSAFNAKDILSRQLSRDIYPVHRLDMQTSGLLMFAFTEEMMCTIQKMFASRQVKKKYVAVLDGVYDGPKDGVISFPLSPDYMNRPRQCIDYKNGKDSTTIYHIMYTREGKTYIELYPQTGRTHQLRVHCAYKGGLGIPIVGDDLYGKHADRLLLHAETLDFIHPVTHNPTHIECKHTF